MSERINHIVGLIDGALADPGQHSSESGPTMPEAGTCWRCVSHSAAEDSASGLCDGCRAFMLEDSDDDPASAGGLLSSWFYAEPAAGVIHWEDIAEVYSQMLRAQMLWEEAPPIRWGADSELLPGPGPESLIIWEGTTEGYRQMLSDRDG